MTKVFITVDTEYSSGLVKGLGPADRADNFARSIACLTPDGPAGVTHKLDLLARYGQKAVFFVDPMPALVWGIAAIEDIVAPIVEAGQDIQLHCHTEWLELAGPNNILSAKAGQNIKDFPLEQQIEILTYARDSLVSAGAPTPIAFRAGNYGANDDTLRALANLGIRYDSSHCPGVANGACDISLSSSIHEPVFYNGVVEVPIGSIAELGGGLRHAQITALSLAEMEAAILHARDTRRTNFTLVSHSFELINRRKLTVNKVVRRRFEGLCREIKAMRGVETADYASNPPLFTGTNSDAEPLPADPLRTGLRVAEQIVSNTLYGAL